MKISFKISLLAFLLANLSFAENKENKIENIEEKNELQKVIDYVKSIEFNKFFEVLNQLLMKWRTK